MKNILKFSMNYYENIGIIIAILFFILNPILGIIIATLFAIQYKYDSNIINLIILISLLLGLINTTKGLASDMIVYEESFQIAKKTNLFQYILQFGKEPLYYLFMYFTSGVINMSFKLFVFLQTFINYVLFLVSIFKFQKKMDSSNITILFSIFLGAFFFELFSLSAHLMRQFLAASILLYYIVDYTLHNKNKWWLLIASLLIHSTVFLFLPFIFLNTFKEKIKIRNLFILLIIIIPFFFIFEPLVSFLANNSPGVLAYIFIRLNEGNFEDLTGSVKSITLVINYTTLGLTFIYYFFSNSKISGIYHFLNILIGLIIFTILVINYPLLSYRYSFYIYFFVPFIIPLFLKMRLIKPFSHALQIIILCILFFRFGYKLEHGAFKYEKLEDVVLNSSINYIYYLD